jgi:carboxyl-terminal processing protease
MSRCLMLQLLLAGWLASTPVWLTAQDTAAETVDEAAPVETAEFDRQLFLDSFDQVWQTVHDVHWDPEKSGAAWDAAREKYRPLVEQASDAKPARAAIEELLKSLDQSHFGIIAREGYSELEKLAAAGGDGWSGMVLRLVEGQPVVARVIAGSPAAQAGIRPGWQLVRVRDTELTGLLESIAKFAGSSFMRTETAFGLIAESAASGQIGERLPLELIDGDGVTRKIEVELVKGSGTPAKFGFLPTTMVECRSSNLTAGDGEVTCLSFNCFLDPVRLNREFAAAVATARENKGLIIDLRGNMGGIVGLTMGMCGWMFKDSQSLGEMPSKKGKLTLNLNPRRPAMTGPVAVLVDECSISAAEIMAGALQDLGRVRVFGRRTAGMVLPSTVVRLPNGDGFQYAVSDYMTASGKRLESTGVEPDVEVSFSRQKLLSANPQYGFDPDLDAAILWISDQ